MNFNQQLCIQASVHTHTPHRQLDLFIHNISDTIFYLSGNWQIALVCILFCVVTSTYIYSFKASGMRVLIVVTLIQYLFQLICSFSDFRLYGEKGIELLFNISLTPFYFVFNNTHFIIYSIYCIDFVNTIPTSYANLLAVDFKFVAPTSKYSCTSITTQCVVYELNVKKSKTY